ncbi:MAG: GntR family transcriptional regulator [Opitutales bacterium]|nr:GntR family transcriptional regulator [Opitutales bacterium]
MKSKNTTLAQRAYDSIFEMLLHKKIKPTEIIKRRDIAAHLNMSLAPVAEAMQRLESDGFLITKPRSETTVVGVDESSVRNLCVLRVAIEAQAARMYASKISDEDFKKLMVLAKKIDSINSEKINWNAEISFHSALVDLAKCQPLSATFDRVMKRNLFYSVCSVFPKNRKASHVKLLNALQKATADEAEKLVRNHISERISLEV